MSLPEIRIEVGFSGPYTGTVFTIGDPTLGKIGSVPIGSGDVWVELPKSAIRSWSIRRGAGQGNEPTRRYDAGTATIILNDGDRRFDPDNLAGPYVSGGVSMIEPMRRVRITAIWAGAAYPLFTGYADDWVPDYQGNFWTYTTLTATDATKVWAAADRTAAAPAGTGELTGARVHRILNSAGWPVADRSIDAGSTTVQATDLSGSALAELQLIQDTELGELFVDPSGRAIFQGRASVLTRAASLTSQATFGDGGYTATGELPYADVKLTSLDDHLANRVTITRAGGTPQTAEDAASIAKYLVKAYTPGELLMETDGEALNRAQALLYRHKTPTRRYARLEFQRPEVALEAVLWPQLLGRAFGDRITIKRRPAGGGAVIEHDAFIRGVEMSSDGARWDSAWVLQAADQLSYFTIGHPDRGRIGAYPVAF